MIAGIRALLQNAKLVTNIVTCVKYIRTVAIELRSIIMFICEGSKSIPPN